MKYKRKNTLLPVIISSRLCILTPPSRFCFPYYIQNPNEILPQHKIEPQTEEKIKTNYTIHPRTRFYF